MEDWLTYRLDDLLLFSPRTYYRLLELYNRDLWPIHAAFVGAGVGILALLRRGAAAESTTILLLLGACWLRVAWTFHLERYATINWAARYFAAAFGVQAALMAWVAIRARRRGPPAPRRTPDRVALGAFAFALFIQPLIGPLVGRRWTQVELFGAAPDPTAVATLGVLAMPRVGAPRYLLVIPALWCAIAGGTSWAMGQPDALVVPVVGCAAILTSLRHQRA